jgi:DNA-binding SARP family transcriptional activator
MTRPEDDRRTQLEYRCLGPVSLRSADGRKLTFRTRKQMALFTFLVRRAGQPHSRDRLIDLLWSEDDLSRARHSLSQSTSLLNKLLGCEAIVVPSKDELLLREGLVWADVAEFERCAAQHRQRDARALWRGNLLEGLWIHHAPNFERWLEAERRRLLETIRRALHEMLATSRTEGAWEHMRSVAESLLELDALDEAAMLALLISLTLLGERTQALRRYAAFEKRLADELGAEPGPETRAWAKRQRRGCDPTGGGPPAEPPSRVSEETAMPPVRPLYGRSAEFARLWQAWDAARGGQGGCIVLLGPAGIGKSALVAKLVDQVRVAEGAACVARCFQTEKCVPFAPVSALVRQMAELPGFVALSQVWISELSRLAPELRDRFPNAPPALAADDSVRHRVCEATCRAGEAISYEEPLLLSVDNAHDADETTTALLHYYGRQAATQRTLLVFVVRAGESGEALGEFAEQAKAQGYGQLQRVGPLEDAHLRRVVADVLTARGLEAPPALVESMARIAHGNPLHATELALAIPAEDGRPASEWLLRGADHLRSGTERFEESASTRLAALSAGARAITAILAVAARPLAEHELLAVSQLAPAELASAVFELERAQLIRHDGGELGFAHDSYAPLADAALPEQERGGIHARLATVLAESAARNPAAQMEVALHLERATKSTEARVHGLAAADFAGSVGAVKERAEALELVRRVSGGYDGQVSAALATCYLGLRQVTSVDALCQQARSHPHLPETLRGQFRYLEIAADNYSGRKSLAEICASLEAMLRCAAPGGFEGRADAMTLLLRVADKTCNICLVRNTARALWRDAKAARGGQPSAHALFARAYVFARYYSPRRALPLLQEAQRKSASEQNWELEHACREGLGVVLKQIGRFSESIEQFQYSLALGRRTLNPQAQIASLVNLAVVEEARGDFDAAAAYLQEAERLDSQYPHWFHRVYRVANQAELALESGRVEDATAKYEEALAHALEMNELRIAMVACSGLALCARARGKAGDLAKWTERLLRTAQGRERVLHDRWYVEAAYAWNRCINERKPDLAVAGLEAALHDLRRRDVDHWLRLELEAIRVEEFISERMATQKRLQLAALARSYSAMGILREAQSSLATCGDPT